jgi:hypothetical protein
MDASLWLFAIATAWASGAISAACVMDVHYSRKKRIQ